MPVLLARRAPDHVARADLPHRPAPTLDEAAAGRDDQRLSEWMGVPGAPRARLEGDAAAVPAGRRGRLEERIDADVAGEVRVGSSSRGLRTVQLDLHGELLRQPKAFAKPARAQASTRGRLAIDFSTAARGYSKSSSLPAKY